MLTLDSYAEGRWIAGSGAAVPLLDPTTEAVLAEARAGGIDFGAALAFARNVGGPALRALTFEQRAHRLEAAVKALHAHRDALIELAVENGGNTRGDAKFDIDGGFGTAMAYVAIGKTLGARRTIVDGEAEALTRGPRYVGQHIQSSVPGAAIHINAFNFPIWGLLEKLGPALIAGVPVVAKPALPSALVAYRAVQLLVDADILPRGALTVLFTEPDGLLDAALPGDVIAFTGSSATGRRIRSHAAVLDGSLRVNVEADSVNAGILGPTAEEETEDLFVREAIREMTQKAGQKCTAIRRLVVPEEHLDRITERFVEGLSAVRTGDPRTTGVTVGPLMSAAQRSRVQDGIARLAEHASFVFGDGGRGHLVDVPGSAGFFVAPTLLRAPSLDTPVVHNDEVFGPVATLLPYDGSARQAADALRRGQGGLAASLYEEDKDFIGAVVEEAGAWVGRLNLGSAKIAAQSPGHGAVLPSSVHGGPGRAGGGQELGGRRGLDFYLQRTVLQGDRPLIEKVTGTGGGGT